MVTLLNTNPFPITGQIIKMEPPSLQKFKTARDVFGHSPVSITTGKSDNYLEGTIESQTLACVLLE